MCCKATPTLLVMYAGVLPSMVRKRPYFLKARSTLRKQEAVFADNSGTMRLVLWESDITRVISKSVYNISKIVVREFDGAKYLTLNKQSVIEPADTSIERMDTEADGLPHSQKVHCPAEGVLSVQRFLSCKKCQTKLVPNPTKNLMKCTASAEWPS